MISVMLFEDKCTTQGTFEQKADKQTMRKCQFTKSIGVTAVGFENKRGQVNSINFMNSVPATGILSCIVQSHS